MNYLMEISLYYGSSSKLQVLLNVLNRDNIICGCCQLRSKPTHDLLFCGCCQLGAKNIFVNLKFDN